MRAVYALIVFFLLLCVFFTRWYLCAVRGLCETAAILEILMMILASFLIGFAGSWLLSENIFRSVRGQVGGLLKEKRALHEQLQLLEKENQSARRHLVEWQQEATQLSEGNKASGPLLKEVQTQVYSLRHELEQYQRRCEKLERESNDMREAASQLQNQLWERNKAEMAIVKTEEKPQEDKKERRNVPRSRFTPSTWQTKDDLTKISGIGPAIQRKLNEAGIYSFQQISQLTPDMVTQVADSIKFFPDRIGRDNWIGQAAALMKQKK